MSIEKIKEQMCDEYCKYLERANQVKFSNASEMSQLAAKMYEICEECPLNRVLKDETVHEDNYGQI